MRDRDKTKEQLIEELSTLRQRIAELEGEIHAGHKAGIQKERAIEEYDQFFRELAENIHLIVWLRSQSRLIYISPAYEELTGRSCQSLYEDPDSFLESVHPEDRERVMEAVNLERNQGKPFREEYRIIRPDGTIRWVLARSAPVSGKGQELRIAGIVEDITDCKSAEQSFRENQTNFHLVTEAIEDVFWISKPDIKDMLYVGPAYENIWGRSYQSPELFIETIHPEDRERFLAEVKKHAKGISSNFEYRIMRPDGSIRWIQNRAFPVRDKDGQVVKVAGIASDITGRKQAEEELKKYRCQLEELVKERTDRLIKTNEHLQTEIIERYRAEDASRLAYAELNQIFEGAAEGICIIDHNRTFLRVNHAFCTLTGFDRDELIGSRCSDIFHCPFCDTPIQNGIHFA
ncbi:MAG: PAS domain-containing protein [bacterium]